MKNRFVFLELKDVTIDHDLEVRKVVVYDRELRNTLRLSFQRHEGTGWYGFQFNEHISLFGVSSSEQSCKDISKMLDRILRKLESMGASIPCYRELLIKNFDYQIESEFLSKDKFLTDVRGY